MLDFILTTVLFTLPEAIIYTFVVIYLLKIRCAKYEKWIALGYALSFLIFVNSLSQEMAMHVAIILTVMPLIFKAWCGYNISYWNYFKSVFCVIIGMFVCEIICGIPLVYMLGFNMSSLDTDLFILALFSIPTRVVEFAILYILNRRYQNV